MVGIKMLNECLESHTEVAAAYLFGSAAGGESVAIDLDIL